MRDFYQLTALGRALRLRNLATAALEEYDLELERLSLITNETNCIFRVDTPRGEKYALRISDPLGCHGVEEIRAEVAWLDALQRDTSLDVPQPVMARDGSLVQTLSVAGIPEARNCVLFGWLPGPNLADRLSPLNLERFGEVVAALHDHGEDFNLPEGCRIRMLDRIFYYSDPSFLYVEPLVLFDEIQGNLMPPVRRDVFQRAVDRVQAALDHLYTQQQGRMVTHNDLHQWNVNAYRGRIYVFDFEDLAWGYPIQDIATTFFYLRGEEDDLELMASFKRGYAWRRSWPEEYPGQIETLMAGRRIMLANYVLSAQELEYRQIAPGYMARAEAELQVFLEKMAI